MSSCLNYRTVIWSVHWYRDWLFLFKPGSLPRIWKWPGRWDHRMPKDRDLGEHKRPPLDGSVCESSPEKKNLDRLFVCFKCFLCWVWDQISIFLVTNFLSKMQGTIFRVKAVTIVYVSLTCVLFHIQHTLSHDMFFDLE